MRARLAWRLAVLPVLAVSGGCVAAAIPLAAAGGIGSRSVAQDRPAPPPRDPEQAARTTPTPSPTSVPPPSSPVAETAATVPAAMRFLYGSGEAAALSTQAYAGLTDFVRARADKRQVGAKLWSVVLNDQSTLSEPGLRACTPDQPLAIILDVDETTVLNLGFEADAASGRPYDPARWSDWERTGGDDVAPVPGVVAALKEVRARDVTVIFNTNRSSAHAADTARMLDDAGLGPAVPGETLFTKSEDVHGKDARRAAIARRYCVIAMAGDQLGDFTDLFDDPSMPVARRRAAAGSAAYAALWGRGWFILPNPVYGSALKGGLDDIFPSDKRWSPTGDKEK